MCPDWGQSAQFLWHELNQNSTLSSLFSPLQLISKAWRSNSGHRSSNTDSLPRKTKGPFNLNKNPNLDLNIRCLLHLQAHQIEGFLPHRHIIPNPRMTGKAQQTSTKNADISLPLRPLDHFWALRQALYPWFAATLV
jgi:hypothetical protein